MKFDKHTDPHVRMDILTGERILVSPHRSKRPWQGQVEKLADATLPKYDPECYLCPGNTRAAGQRNPNYKHSFVFENDFAALLNKDAEFQENDDDLFISSSERGICKVISFSARHDLTLAEMTVQELTQVVDVWQREFLELSQIPWIQYIQIFENKGAIMGCSNPHPHGQIWAQSSIPSIVQREESKQKLYFDTHQKTLLSNYIQAELKKQERIIIESDYFVVVVPYWAKWPYETLLVSKRAVADIGLFSEAEKIDLAFVLQQLTIKYDNLFHCSFPYSAGMHQAPTQSLALEAWHWHMHFYPPLLRSATVKKFMVGYEMLADAQRDITPELAAQHLREVSSNHYKTKL